MADNPTELYELMKDDPDTDWGRIVYEIPHGEGWADVEGYITGELDGFITVSNEDEIRKVPGSRIIYEQFKPDS